MEKKNKLIILLVSTYLLLNIQAVSANQYYVATFGNNNNSGSLFAPWQNISYGVQQIQPGDTLYLINGTWYNENIKLNKSGTYKNPIFITAYNGTPTLIGNDKDSAISILAYPTDVKYITVSNLKIKNYNIGIYIEASSGNTEISQITVKNNSISNIKSHPIYAREIGTSYYQVNNLTICNNNLSSFNGSGIYMLSVRDSNISNNNIRDSKSSSGLVGIGYDMVGCTIKGNKIENISSSYGISGMTDTYDNIIQDNVIQNTSGRGIRFDSRSSGNYIKNNTISNTLNIGLDLYPKTNTRVENNLLKNCSIWIVGVNNTSFRNNIIKNCTINICGLESARCQVTFENNTIYEGKKYLDIGYCNNSTFKNNVFKNISSYSALLFSTGKNSPCYNVTLDNNTFQDINGKGIYIGWSPVYNLTISNNSFINITSYCIDNSYRTNVTVSHNNVWNSTLPFFNSVNDTETTCKDPDNIAVKQVNSSLVIISFEPANESVFNEGQRIKISLNASDTHSHILKYIIKIDGTICSASSGYIWNTDYLSSGNHSIEMITSDGINEAKKVITVYINDYHPRWDVDKSGKVDFSDINTIAQKYGTVLEAPYPDWDTNQDGIINLEDLLLTESHFGENLE